MSDRSRGFLEGGGSCGKLIAEREWSTTAVGPIETWPASLTATVANMLHSRQPMLLFWGPDLVQFYNDAFVPSFGQGKHPEAMGQRAEECWADAWPVVGAQIEAVMSHGEPAWHEDALVPIFRNGRMEEVFWTYSYSPAFDDRGAVQGTLVIVTEMTGRVLSRRRLEVLALLGKALWTATTYEEIVEHLGDLSMMWPSDLPYVAVRGADSSTSRELREIELLDHVAGPVWPEPITRALTCAVGSQHELIVGLSPRLPLDDAYRSFVAQIVGQVDTALAQVSARLSLSKSDDERSRIMLALQDANRQKDEFLAMLGHELRNPLAPIVSALELLDQKNASGGPERAVIERQLRHVIRLVDDLLDISKITRGVVELDVQVIDFREVVKAAIEASRPLVQQKEQQLVVEATEAIFVKGDETRLVQVVSNLLTNASRYTPANGTIRVTLFGEAKEAILEVADTGIGISADLLPKIFDTFVQGVRSADRAEGGLGLGLSIARNLISLHGGSVSAHSDGAGKGSLFRIRLARVDDARRGQPAARAPVVTESRRVLVVDDNEDAGELLGEIARMRGHHVTVVQHPARALEVVADFDPEIAVLDIGLPDMDGYQLAARLRALVPKCRLVALTGYGQLSDRARTREAGFMDHLVKPVRVEQLLAVIEKVWE